jgi:nitrous oxidase accessory protein
MARNIVLALACLTVLLAATGGVFFSPSTKASTVITVPTDYPTIQEAVNAANLGDTVKVLAGTYYEHVVVNKSISLMGENCTAVVVDGDNGSNNVFSVVADNVSICGFTIRNGHNGVFVEGENCSISGNVITGNKGDPNGLFPAGDGILLNYTIHARIYDNSITSNGGGMPGLWWGNGIECFHSWYNWISSNNVSHNEVSGIGVFGSNNTIDNNILTGNDDTGISVGGDFNLITDNAAFANDYGITLFGSSYNVVRNNSLWGNGYWDLFGPDPKGGGIALSWSSANIIEENTIWGSVSFGIDLSDLNPSNVVRGNTVFDNPSGIHFHYSNGTTVYHNNFVNNSRNADVGDAYPDAEAWDNGAEGNYWSNFTGADVNVDGIIDAPYVLDARNRDNYPLAEPWSEARTFPIIWDTVTYNVTTVSDFTVAGCSFNQPSKYVGFSMTGPSNSTSPLNVTIPLSLMWGSFFIFVDDVPQPFTINQNTTHAIIQSTVLVNSTRHVKVFSTEVVPEYNPTMLALFLLITTLSMLVVTRKLKKASRP